jgi:signal transduction histidine kinase/ligand-binding sensor domain-containing protein/CheY-like chemotaxis protein
LIAILRFFIRRLPSLVAWPILVGATGFLTGVAAPGAIAANASSPVASFVHLSDDEGLAHSDVRAITQDQQGFIWFGLRLGGLTRYDGYELKVYKHDPTDPRSIGNQIIWSLLVDRRGTLWIGTEGGLDRYDRETDSFIHYRPDATRPGSLANNVVTCIFEDAAGKIWAGTRGGLCRLDDPLRDTFTTFSRPRTVEGSSAKDTFRSIIEDPTTGLFWLGASDGLAAFDPQTGAFASFVHDPNDPTSLSRNAVNKVIRDEQGVFWALTEYGLNSFRPTFNRVPTHTLQQPRMTFQRFIQPGGSANPGINYVRDGLIDRKHRLWLATRGGVSLFDRAAGTFTEYRRNPANPTSLSDDMAQTIFEDKAGSIWVGTFAGGANRLQSEDKPFRIHRHQPGDPHSVSEDRIAGLALDRQGRLWASTTNGLNCYDGTKWTRFFNDPADPTSLPSNDLSGIATAPNGDVWVGSNYYGVYRFDQSKFNSHPTSPSNIPAPNGWHSFTGGQVNSILADNKGGVWLGARTYGLDYYKDGRFLHFNPQEATDGSAAQPTTNPILGLFAPNGDLWFATEFNGLVHFQQDTQRFTAYQLPITQPGAARSLHCIADGGDGIIWLGAADGLLKFDLPTKSFVRQYSTSDGLPNAAIMSIVRDLRGHLWLGTANGLADFDPASEKSRNYDKPDGLPTNVFSQRAGALGPDGRIYLGTRAGIVEFAPAAMQDNPVPPAVVLTELRWLGTPPKGPAGKPVAIVSNIGNTIRVPAGQPGFSLKFSALDFIAPAKNRYRHRLEGWDQTWNEASASERSVTYTALPPGEYTFRVQGCNADQVWNTQGTSLRIIVEPYIWQTTWFRCVISGVFLGLLLTGVRWRIRVIGKRNALLQQLVSQRTAELQQEMSVRKQAESALRESHAELEQRVKTRTAELAQTNKSLQTEIAERENIEAQLRQSQKMEAIGQLAGGVAHDFNNLLTVILGQSEMLTETSPPLSAAERDGAVRDIKEAAQRATNLTRQLLVFSRHQSLTPVAVDLNQLVTGLSKLLRHLIGEHIELKTRLAPTPLGVLADPGMLEQVLLNIVLNARDAMPSGGRLAISSSAVTVKSGHPRPAAGTAKPGDYVCLSVNDTGGGIPSNILPQIFEPFFTTKESGKGTGLGLAITQGIVQKHGGWIEVETSSGQGTTFHVFLPRHDLVTTATELSANTTPLSGNATTILVAEDEQAVRTIVNRLLTRQGYRVIEASSGPEALERWAQYRDQITILLTDIVMPGHPDGHELAAKLLKERPELRVITMSGYDPSDIARTNENIHIHVRKPFTNEGLLKAIDSTKK